MALSFPTNAILKVYETMVGTPANGVDEEVQDIVGELTNIVVGGAKKELVYLGYPYHISIPMVVSGKDHVIRHKHDRPIIAIPFKIEDQIFTMEISIKVED